MTDDTKDPYAWIDAIRRPGTAAYIASILGVLVIYSPVIAAIVLAVWAVFFRN